MVEYIAFGEVLFEEHSSSFSSPYLFNGKELDRETNLSYYGARYYDAKTSLWLNMDPLAEKYPNYSGYSYCFNNPIKFLDPDGRDPHPSKAFLNSVYGKIYTYLAENNSAFKKMLSKYSNNKKFNTYYVINDKAVAKLGNAAAFTVSKPTKEGGIKSTSTFPSDGSVSEDYEYNDLGIFYAVIHEGLHQNIGATKITDDQPHNNYNKKVNLLIEIISEYSNCNNLNLNADDVVALAQCGQQSSRSFKKYIQNMADKNGITYVEQKKKYDIQVSKLIHQKKVKNEKTDN